MTRYIASRLVFMIPVILGITLLSFVIIKILPGDLAVAMLSGPLFYRRFITRQPVSPRVVDAIVTTVLAGLRA